MQIIATDQNAKRTRMVSPLKKASLDKIAAVWHCFHGRTLPLIKQARSAFSTTNLGHPSRAGGSPFPRCDCPAALPEEI
jgi:hypothetical protein